ncbi:MAG: 3-deoxy-D-manno-octulosonic acid transferase [Rhodobacteraceae bacterium]|nr:3-deoxy-D-manno-octulosonic acid transferase [Paracoccaceae bacterium]
MGLPSPSTRAKPWRKSAAADARPPRPKGELIWAHATTTERFFALGDLGQRLKMMRPDLSLILTCEPSLAGLPIPDGYDRAIGELPADQPADVRSFLNHWRPDICLWTGGNLRPVLMRACGERGINALLIDIEADELPARGRRWLPDKSRKLLDKFSVILTPSPAAFAQLRRSSLAADKIALTSRLRLSSILPTYHEDELSRMRDNLGSRQIWLSAHTRLGEIDTIIDAHRNALRLLHRLLLVLSIEQYSDLDAARDALKDTGLRWADWEAGENLDDNTQVLLTCDEDLGLWYRVAPLSLLAGTLEVGASGHNPMDAAALGSAILHGPHLGLHAPLYERLAKAGAAQQVQDKDQLAVQIIQLSAPDKAAEMAVAGWQVVTESAELTDLLLDQIQDMLDLREARHATP